MQRREGRAEAAPSAPGEAVHDAHGTPRAPPRPQRPAPQGFGRVTFVLDRDLRVLEVVSPTDMDGRVHNWVDLIDASDHAAAYDALSRALVSHRFARCELRFTRFWTGQVLTCTFLRSPLSRTPGGFLVHVDAP